MRIFNLCLTGLLTAYAVYSQKRYGDRKAGVMGTGFFAIAFYLDSIFWLIMKNAADGSHPVPTGSGGMGAEPEMAFQLMGILISKSIVVIGLTAWTIIRQNLAVRSADGLGTQSDREESGGWYAGSRQGSYSGRYGGPASGKGWQYLDGLTVGIGVFSVLLALECMDSGKGDFRVALRLIFLLLLLASYYISLFFYRKKCTTGSGWRKSRCRGTRPTCT